MNWSLGIGACCYWRGVVGWLAGWLLHLQGDPVCFHTVLQRQPESHHQFWRVCARPAKHLHCYDCWVNGRWWQPRSSSSCYTAAIPSSSKSTQRCLKTVCKTFLRRKEYTNNCSITNTNSCILILTCFECTRLWRRNWRVNRYRQSFLCCE